MGMNKTRNGQKEQAIQRSAGGDRASRGQAGGEASADGGVRKEGWLECRAWSRIIVLQFGKSRGATRRGEKNPRIDYCVRRRSEYEGRD